MFQKSFKDPGTVNEFLETQDIFKEFKNANIFLLGIYFGL